MIHYAAASWNPAHADAGHRARSFEGRILASHPHARSFVSRPGWIVMTWNDAVGTARLVDQDGVIVGKVYGARGRDGIEALGGEVLADASDFRALCALLADRFWGAYVLLWADPASQAACVFRDPMGALDCVSWEHDGLRVITSDARTCMQSLRSSDIGIEWDRLGEVLIDPATMIDASLLRGVVPIVAGEAVEFHARSAQRTSFWDAATVAKRACGTMSPASTIRDGVRECMARGSPDAAQIGCEISGGLDSAVIATILAQSRSVTAGFHYFTQDAVGDEREHARSVARHIGLDLVETVMPVRPLCHNDLLDLPLGNRPSIGAVSLFYDRDLAERAAKAGITTLYTGQGGDAVFFQHAAIEIAGECRGSWRQQTGQLSTLALWTGQSFWSALTWRLLRNRRCKRHMPPLSFVMQTPRPIGRSPVWAGDIENLSPAKRLHVEALFRARLAFGASWTSKALDVVHPLLSQPIVEAVLALPIMTLTEGFRDRGLARRAFASDLPASVVNRYGKGSLTSYFGRCLARSLPFLREFLLGGMLAGHDIVARDRLDVALDVDYLMRNDIYPELIWLVLAEHWVRGWDATLKASRSGLDRLGAMT